MFGSEHAGLQVSHEHTGHDGGERWTFAHPAGPVVLETFYDVDTPSPVDPGWSDLVPALAMIPAGPYGRCDYVGFADDIPHAPRVECTTCGGDGEHNGAECAACDGYGERDAVDVAEYVRLERDAVASLEIDYGRHGEARAVLYVDAATVQGWGSALEDVPGILETFARELQRWSDGECYGYSCTGPGAYDDACAGFIGYETLEEVTAETLAAALEAADREQLERAYWHARDVVTVA